MGKKRSYWNERKFYCALNEGMSQASGAEYNPSLTTHDVPSKGINTRIYCHKTNRIHHYFSRNELYYHYLLVHNPFVVDIREQFQLDIKLTLRISELLDIRHPEVNGLPFPMTCDFVIVTADGKWHARTVKMVKDLSDKRVLDKFRIEAYYWKLLGIDFKIVTEKETNTVKAENLLWLYSGERFSQIVKSQTVQKKAKQFFLELYASESITFRDCLEYAEREFALPKGGGLALFKELFIEHAIDLDLEHPIDKTDPRNIRSNRV